MNSWLVVIRHRGRVKFASLGTGGHTQKAESVKVLLTRTQGYARLRGTRGEPIASNNDLNK